MRLRFILPGLLPWVPLWAGEPPDPHLKEYAARAALLGAKAGAPEWLELAAFCETRLLFKEREQALRNAVRADPESAEAHAGLGEARVGKTWLPADRAWAKEEAEGKAKGLVFYGEGWVTAREADRLRSKDRESEGWDLTVRIDTPQLLIFSSLPVSLTWRLAALLRSEAEAYARLSGTFWKLGRPERRMKAYCTDRKEFERLLLSENGTVPPPTQCGLYRSSTRILYVSCSAGEPRNEAKILQCAVHEMSHGCEHQLAGLSAELPLWLAEGLGDYWCHSTAGWQVIPGKAFFRSGDAGPALLKDALASPRLDELVAMREESFDQEGPRNYALSWALVHFLLHGDEGAHAEGFLAFLKQVQEDPGKADLWQSLGSSADKLEGPFKAYVTHRLLPSIQDFK